MCRLLFLTALSCAWFAAVHAQDRPRSMVVTDRGIVATSHVLASQAGAQILAKGGSAMDSAIAANAVLGVTEPMMDGIGGDLFLLYWDAKNGKLYGLNASGWAPQGLTIDFLKKRGITSMPKEGIHSVTVPGAVDGWAKAHQRFGRLPWKDLFSPAVYYAENGYAVPEIIHDFWIIGRDRLKQTQEAQRVFLPKGKPPDVGQMFSNPGLGKTLRLLADKGPREFYQGEIAQAIVETSTALGGTMQAGDLAEFSSEWVEPISIEYRGWKSTSFLPMDRAWPVLEMLNIVAASQPDKQGPLGTVELHKKIEAMKLAYTDLYRYNGDPRFAVIPLRGLLSKEYADQRARLIDPQKANCAAANGTPPKSDTTYLAVVDRDGNIASLIQSDYDFFGSGLAVSGMGFILQDGGGLFVLDPRHPNALASRKRPFHTIIPAFMERGDEHIGFGIMGGSNQPLAHAQFVSHVADYGWNIQAALSAPRFTIRDTGEGIKCSVLLESRVVPEVQAQLRQQGHELVLRKEYSAFMGRARQCFTTPKRAETLRALTREPTAVRSRSQCRCTAFSEMFL